MISKRLAALATAAALIAGAAVTPAAAYPNATPFRPNVGVVVLFASTASVILDAMYISATQCREMTQQEAFTALLPAVGPIYNAYQPSQSRCAR